MLVEKITSPKIDDTTTASNLLENGQGDSNTQRTSNTIEIIQNKNENESADIENKGSGNVEEKISSSTSKVQYSLSAVVCYVDDKNNEERRNLVALLRVGPSYHKRSTGSAVSQWYIFNDFW